MSGMDGGLGRRQVLGGTGAGGVALGGVGTAFGRTPERTGEFIVGAKTRSARRQARGEAREVTQTIEFEEPERRHAVAGTYTTEGLEELRECDQVAYVEPNGTYEASAQTLPWGVDRVDADVAHESGPAGRGKSVAIIDSGIDSNHTDLRVWGGASFGTECQGDGTTCRRGWDDDNGHGTHCAGIDAARDGTGGVVGVSPSPPLYAVKVLGENGSGKWSAIAAGIKWTADNNVKVGSLSLGGNHSETIRWACADAYERGVLLVSSAGNSGSTVSYPTRYRTVVAVGATDRSDSLASFSSKGSAVELAAPGVAIQSALPGGGYGTKSSTSMACPHVSGAASQVLAHVASATNNRRARRHLRRRAEDLGADGWDEEFGYGLVDVAGALGLDSSENLPD